MPLKLTLKPNEKVLIGTAVLTNAGSKAEIIIQNNVPVLREKDIITEENADTIAKKIYFIVLNMYVDAKNEAEYHTISTQCNTRHGATEAKRRYYTGPPGRTRSQTSGGS